MDSALAAQLIEELRHIRFVHFSLLATCATIFYVSASTVEDSQTTALALDRLEGALPPSREFGWFVTSDHGRDEVNRVAARLAADLHEQALGWLGKSDLTDDPFEALDPTDNTVHDLLPFAHALIAYEPLSDLPDSNTSTLEQILATYSEAQWAVVEVLGISIPESSRDVLQEALQRIDDHQGYPLFGSTPLCMTLTLNGPLVSSSTVAGELALGHTYFMPRSGKRQESYPIAVHVSVARQPARIPGNWIILSEPLIAEEWSRLKDRTLTEADVWVRKDLLKRLRGREVVLLGTAFDGQHLIVIALPAVIGQLLYLLLHVRQLLRITWPLGPEVGRTPAALAPWLGMYEDGAARAVMFLSLVVLPSASLGVLINVSLDSRTTMVGMLLMVTVAGVGWLGYRTHRNVAQLRADLHRSVF